MNPDSLKRYEIAKTLSESYPLSAEIAITGSTARGIATEQSDLEINVWCDELPPTEQRETWLKQAGVQEIVIHPQPRPDDSYWISGKINGVDLEVGWQTWQALDSAVAALLTGTILDHGQLRLADLVLTAIPLTSAPKLQLRQGWLRRYPPELKKNLVEAGRSWLQKRQAATITDDLAAVLRLLFALNEHWEVNWKQAHLIVDELNIKPDHLAEKIQRIRNGDEAELERLITDVMSSLDESV